MNAALRAIVRSGVYRGFEIYGVRDGYTGLMAGELARLGPREVGGIIGRAGTFLGTTRCEELRTDSGQATAIQQLRAHGISELIVIGGNGSQAGALALARRGARVLGVASTIDNDLPGIDVTLGSTTALEVALEAIDRLRETASSHKRAFLVEVMGRNCGYLALMAGIAGGAEAIVVPEVPHTPEAIADEIRSAYGLGKSHAIVVVAEGAEHNAASLSRYFDEHAQRLGFELRVTKLGHTQRGGAPCVVDRMIATQLGAAAVEHLEAGRHGLLLGMVNGQISAIDLALLNESRKPLDTGLVSLARVLAR